MKLLKKISSIVVLSLLFSCSSNEKRTKLSDPVLTIFVDDKGINQIDYSAVQQALYSTGKFIVLDRNVAYEALRAEQNRQYRDRDNRYSDLSKYAQWGRVLGAGGVVTASYNCRGSESSENIVYFIGHLSTLGMFDRTVCEQFLQITDASTGEVVASIKHEGKKNKNETLDWSDAVNKLIETYPDTFATLEKSQRLIKFEVENLRIAQQKKLEQLEVENNLKHEEQKQAEANYQNECGDYHKRMDSFNEEAEQLKATMIEEYQKLSDSSEIVALEKKFKKQAGDFELKIYQLGTNPKYKNCRGNLYRMISSEQ